MNNILVSNCPKNTHFIDDIRDLNVFKELTILMVDDDENMRFLIAEIFEIYGTKVMTATNPLEAFELIRKIKLDLLISDINMPERNGYWLIQQVRTLTDSKNREIPAIAFTGDAGLNIQKKAIAAGFQTCICKTSTIEQLVTEITKLLKPSWKLRREE
ncbi:response regulator [Anabaena sp. FACHB-709]|uniref:Two-component response regulator n=2 Tax=Nostocaceae TaxID=1162 RepID=A0A1Z4KNM2_ANAVA|nr:MULTISPECIES: response regulator [Nostocaceae]BAY70534.1 two-component response regulator [Trichormus variabilis NIES-23]HBW32252.1 response regulator [Nostoc sp. UBA8866]MBD2173244.1 response regulator [Anabaena cylindrica FACHB-318]MBD2264995.1 response regulator [Anabaena sp. FACHB-709]MBD2274305.1 response regulator [Nostoc sp. PCC 7120 = FACHB-418]